MEVEPAQDTAFMPTLAALGMIVDMLRRVRADKRPALMDLALREARDQDAEPCECAGRKVEK
jgi:hypothetical protein